MKENYTPEGNRLLVQVTKVKDLASGLVLPDSVKKREGEQRLEVIAVGAGVHGDVRPGDCVLVVERDQFPVPLPRLDGHTPKRFIVHYENVVAVDRSARDASH